jgi:hypothetical protein
MKMSALPSRDRGWITSEKLVTAQPTKVLIILLALAAHSALGQNLLLRPSTDVDRRHEFFKKFPTKFITAFKKFGEMDFKQHSSLYEGYTGFMFGAVGAKAGIAESSIMDLVRAANPTQDDVELMKSMRLEEQFELKKHALEELLSLSEQDSHLFRISLEYTAVGERANWPKGKERISDSRWSDYKRRFKKLGVTEGIVRTYEYPDATFFVVHAEGLCVAGCSCGYVHSKTAMRPTSDHAPAELEQRAKANAKEGGASVYSAKGNGWYVFYEMDWR